MPGPNIQFMNASQGSRICTWDEALDLFQNQKLPFDTSFCAEGDTVWRPITEFHALQIHVTGVAPIMPPPQINPAHPTWQDPLPVQPLKNLAILATVAVGLAGLGIIAAIIYDFRLWFTLGPSASEASKEVYLFGGVMLPIVNWGLLIVAAICWISWHYRAATNMQRLGARTMTYGPPMAIISYLVPIGNWVLPALALNELQNYAKNISSGKHLPASPNVIVFGIAWFIGQIAGLDDAFGLEYLVPGLAQAMLALDIVGNVATLVAAIAGLSIVWTITRLQEPATL